MTEEGKREFKAIYGKDVEVANFQELSEMLYGGKSFTRV